MPYVEHRKLFLEYLMTPRVLKVLRNFQLDGVFHMGQDCDNPYSEALFRTCKYCPAYPTQGFAGLAEARAWMQPCVYGYNHEHCPSGIRFVTPQQRHSGQDQAILAQRQAIYEQARARHPERWSRAIRNWNPITEVWLNPTAEVIDVPAGHSQTG
jgi:putative transposase